LSIIETILGSCTKWSQERLRGEQEAINSPGLSKQDLERKRGDQKFPVRALLSTGRAMEGNRLDPENPTAASSTGSDPEKGSSE
jgi:hypothetical protein